MQHRELARWCYNGGDKSTTKFAMLHGIFQVGHVCIGFIMLVFGS
jgi:hypothetical protein